MLRYFRMLRYNQPACRYAAMVAFFLIGPSGTENWEPHGPPLDPPGNMHFPMAFFDFKGNPSEKPGVPPKILENHKKI